MFVWSRLTAPGADAREFAKQAIERGVAFIPGTPFYAEKPDHATLRFSFATSSIEKIEEGVARLKA
jgi:2-aminoadipate transaminase